MIFFCEFSVFFITITGKKNAIFLGAPEDRQLSGTLHRAQLHFIQKILRNIRRDCTAAGQPGGAPDVPDDAPGQLHLVHRDADSSDQPREPGHLQHRAERLADYMGQQSHPGTRGSRADRRAAAPVLPENAFAHQTRQ